MGARIKKVPDTLKDYFFLSLLLIILFIPYLVTHLSLSYIAYNNSSDSFLYLDIAKNIATGKGFVTSFNGYQYWPGVSYPAISFIHIGLPLVLSFAYPVLKSVNAFISLNFILGFLNCLLLFAIVRKMYRDRALAAWAVFLYVSSVSLEIVLFRILTEPWSLALLFIATLVFISPARARFAPKAAILACLLALACLFRSSSIIYAPGFFLAMLLNSESGLRQRAKEAFVFLGVFLCLVAFFEFGIFLKFNSFFPQYPAAFKNFYASTFLVGGQFFDHQPVVRPLIAELAPVHAGQNFFNAMRVLFCILRVFCLFALLRVAIVFKTRQKGEILLLTIALIQLASTLFLYPYMEIHEFEMVRFLILPAIALAVLGLRGWRDFTVRFFPRTKTFIFHAVIFIVFLSNFYQSFTVLKVYWQEEESGKVGELSAIADWVKKHTKESDLIASTEFIYGGVYLDRPVVAMPFFKTLDQINLRKFLSIYSPKVLIFEKNLLLDRELEQFGYKKAQDSATQSGNFLIYFSV